MGLLKPGTEYIYERSDDGVVYAREFGAAHEDRFAIGHCTNDSKKVRSKLDQLAENKLWRDIRQTARNNPALQAELERVIMLYHLMKTNE